MTEKRDYTAIVSQILKTDGTDSDCTTYIDQKNVEPISFEEMKEAVEKPFESFSTFGTSARKAADSLKGIGKPLTGLATKFNTHTHQSRFEQGLSAIEKIDSEDIFELEYDFAIEDRIFTLNGMNPMDLIYKEMLNGVCKIEKLAKEEKLLPIEAPRSLADRDICRAEHKIILLQKHISRKKLTNQTERILEQIQDEVKEELKTRINNPPFHSNARCHIPALPEFPKIEIPELPELPQIPNNDFTIDKHGNLALQMDFTGQKLYVSKPKKQEPETKSFENVDDLREWMKKGCPLGGAENEN